MNIRTPLFNSFILLWMVVVEIVPIACGEPTLLSVDEVPAVATVNTSSISGIQDSKDFDDDDDDDDDDYDDAIPIDGTNMNTLHPTTFWRTKSSDEAEGEWCRMQLLNEWLNDNNINSTEISSPQEEGTFDIFSLKAIRETTLYKTILEDCSFFLNEFNLAAGTTCLRQEQNYDTSYSDFWKIGPINMDGGWLLAADILLSNNLEDSNQLVPCSDSCYVRYPRGVGESDCQRSEANIVGSPYFDITKITSISTQKEFTGEAELWRNQRVLCDLGWLNTDRTYQNLRMCASESKVARTMISEKDNRNGHGTTTTNGVSERTKKASLVANAFAAQRQKQAECAESAIEFVCPQFDEALSYDAYDDDYFYHSHGNDDWTTTSSSSAPFVAIQRIVATASAALFILLILP